jgi:hypothetical protein
MYKHEKIIAEFIKINPHYRTSGLGKFLAKMFPEQDTGISFKKRGYIPDAFYVTPDCLYLLEVDKSSILDDKKLPKILSLWHDLDCIGSQMHMTIISGYTLAVSQIDDWAFARMWNDDLIGNRND